MNWQRWKEWPWGLWRRQVWAILRLELRKSFFSRRAWWIYLLVLAPIVLCAGHSLAASLRSRSYHSLSDDIRIYANIYQFFLLRFAVFFGCVGIFTNLFRGEVLERTLHYYWLAPVRREVVAAGKYLSGVIAAGVLFALSAGLSYLLVPYHFGPGFEDYLLQGEGMQQLAAYVSVTVLACAGYGAVFLLMGLLYQNPMIPAAVVMVWEFFNQFLPEMLKKFSIIFYLKSLCPVPVNVKGPLAVLVVDAEPTPAWLAVPGLLVVSLLLLALAARQARNLQVTYSE